MITDPAKVVELAARNADQDRYFAMFLTAFCRWPDAKLNRVAARLGRAAAAAMDCTTCGACCRQNVVPVVDEEVERLATRLRLAVLEFRGRFVMAEAGHASCIDAHPCPFLSGNRCGVYEDRPEPCRGYPYVEGDVRSRLLDIMDRIGVCPIVFEQWQRLKEETGFTRIWSGRDA